MRFINQLVQEQVDTVIESIIAVMSQYKVLTVGYSGGKDSSVLLDITIKAMQIAYEGNMVFAARMGRVEQMETQFKVL